MVRNLSRATRDSRPQSTTARPTPCRQHPVGNTPSATPSPPKLHNAYSYSLGTLLLLITLASLCCGLLATVPGLGILVCILLIPALIYTAKTVRRREVAGREIPPSEKIALLTSSLIVTAVLAILTCATAFCAVCGTLLTTFSFAGGPYGDPRMILMGALMYSIMAGEIYALYRTFKEIRSRSKEYEPESTSDQQISSIEKDFYRES